MYTETFVKDTLGQVKPHNMLLVEESYKDLLKYQKSLREQLKMLYENNPQSQETIQIPKEELKLLLLNFPTYRIEKQSSFYTYRPYATLEEIYIINTLQKIASYESDQLSEEELKRLSNFLGNGSIRNQVFESIPRGLVLPIKAIPLLLRLTEKQQTVNRNLSIYKDLCSIFHLLPEKNSEKKLSLNYQEDE